MATNIFDQAKKLKAKYPKKYKDWTDYVSWQGRINRGEDKPAKKAAGKTKPKKRSAGKAAVKPKAVGSVQYHKSQARKQLEEQLAWLLLARDQEHRKRERLKLSKKVALKRQELHKLK